MDVSTITLFIGLISCAIGVSTYISGRMARAERNGSMETNIKQALEGITSINRKLEESSRSQHESELLIRSHDEQIKTLYRLNNENRALIEEGNKTRDVLVELLHAMQSMSLNGGKE